MRTFTRRFLRYPDKSGRRQAEGGRRLKGAIAKSRPDAPLVTIVTVCFNSADTIEQTIQSVLAQDYDNIEYVIVDGRSTDSTLDIIGAYQDGIDYFVSEPDGGIYDAMNRGLELAQGEYILLLNSDDWYEPDAVSRLVAALDYSGCDFTGALARYVGEDGSSHVLPTMSFDHATLLRMPLRHETMLIPASLYDRVGPYDTQFPIIGDFDYTIRLFSAGATYYEVPAPLLNFRTSGVSSTDLQQLHHEHGILLRKVFPFLSDAETDRIADHSKALPEDFIEVANTHLDQPKFVLAVRAMIKDFGRLWGGAWADARLQDLAADAPGTYPAISVVLPIYRAESFIADTIATVQMQDFTDLEIICVNDCSPDNSAEVIAGLSAADPRIRLLENAVNSGPAYSRNAGIRAARGRYVFFLDADDAMAPNALGNLYRAAEKNGSTIVRGAMEFNRKIHGQMSTGIKYPGDGSGHNISATTLAETPSLLTSTEGHWAGLYDREFVECVLYPEGLRMGEDSLFLIKAMALAEKVTLISDVVYIYQDNAESAMSVYSFEKYMNEVEWRYRAWAVLNEVGQRERADYFLFSYWNPPFFKDLDQTLSDAEHRAFYSALHKAFVFAGAEAAERSESSFLKTMFEGNFVRHGLISEPLKIAVVTTSDSGGAGLASQRSMGQFRAEGLEAYSIAIFKKSSSPDVHVAPLKKEAAALFFEGNMEGLWDEWLRVSTVESGKSPFPHARELFARNAPIVEPAALGEALQQSDIIHMHWVVGMLDMQNMEDIVGSHPVVWTLHDMGPFTGGCHYSEGCTNYRDECRNCPLLEEGETFAHETWKARAEAYAKIETLHIVTPSQWLADCAAESSLFKGREIHVIPNALPVDRFVPTNKMVARRKLGLPLDARLIVFGADSLANTRKGGDILVESIRIMKEQGLTENLEGVFFGNADLDIDIPVHNMGYVTDLDRLSLIYAAADVFAFPSREDNAPQTVPEALLSGTPVVAFPVGNVPELIMHLETGFVARYDDAAHFAEGLAWALEAPRSAKALMRGVRGHIAARAYHEPRLTVEGHMELYRKIRAKSAGNAALEAGPA